MGLNVRAYCAPYTADNQNGSVHTGAYTRVTRSSLWLGKNPPTGESLVAKGYHYLYLQRHSRYREYITRQAEPVQYLLSVAVSGISKEQRYDLARNYYNLRLELFHKHMNELKAGLSGEQYSRLTSLVAVDVRCLIGDDCVDLSARIMAWNIDEDPRLNNLARKVYNDYRGKALLTITGRRS